MKLTPFSSAWSIMRIDSALPVLPPNIMAPRQISLTRTPVLPSDRWFIAPVYHRAGAARRRFDARGSVALQSREAIAMEGRVSERQLRHPRPLHEQADVVLVGHADAAVHLERLVGEEDVGIGAARLRVRDLDRGVVRSRIDRAGGSHHGR